MTPRPSLKPLGLILLTLAPVLWSLHQFVTADLAAVLGGLAMTMANLAGVAIYLHERLEGRPGFGTTPHLEMSDDVTREEPTLVNSVRTSMLCTELLVGLWLGLVAAQPLVTVPAYLLILVAIHGLTGTLRKRLTSFMLTRLGVVGTAACIGYSIKAGLGH